MLDLRNFWPTREALSAVVRSQAEDHESEAFLAVHQPMQFRQHAYGGTANEVRVEEDLLEFLLDDNQDGAVIAPVFGGSGVGKSHAILWLYEQLRRRPDDSRFALVWVQRTQAAKSILGDLLRRDAFSGSEWDDVKSQFHQAQEGLGIARASMELRTEMVHRLRNEPPVDATATEAEFLRQLGRDLASFVEDPNVWTIPSSDTIERAGSDAAKLSPWLRLSQQMVAGGTDPDDEGARRFLASDFEFLPRLGQQIGAQALSFWEYLQIAAPVAGGVSIREAALDVLNRVLDGAQASVLGLGRTPVSELFIALRRRLHEQGRELILLIEDLTVMTGLQRSLLDVMMQPSSSPAGDALCTIRTALALTPGFMQGGALPDNVMTRAKYEWWVEDRLNDDQIIARYEALTASYLNAARWVQMDGTPKLRCYGESLDDVTDSAREALVAFGRDPSSGRFLFPFNREAVAVLSRREVQDAAGRLVYNPRRFINTVLEPLVRRREQFAAGRFPADGDWPTIEDQDVATRLVNSAPAAERARLLAAVATWGGQPTAWSQVERLPAAIFTAFGLTPPEGTTDDTPQPPPPMGGHEDTERPQPPVADPLSAQSTELGAWRSNPKHQLPQAMANEIRKAVAQFLSDLLPTGWPGLSSYRPDDLRKHIYIHRAVGNNQLTAASALVSLPARKPSGDETVWVRYQNELTAVLRWYRSGGAAFNYYAAPESLPHLMSFGDRILVDAADFLRSRPFHLNAESAQSTLRSAVALQLLASDISGGSVKGSLEDRLADLLRGDDGPAGGVVPEEVGRALETLRSTTSADGSVRRYLLQPYAAFQGKGTMPRAVDAAGLLRLMKGVEPSLPTAGDLNAIERGLADRLLPELRALKQWCDTDFDRSRRQLLLWFGDESPTAIRDEATALASQALDAGQATGEAKDVRAAAEGIDAGRAKNLLSQLGSMTKFAPSVLRELNSLDWETWAWLQSFTEAVDVFLDALSQHLGHLAVTEGEDLNAAILNTFEGHLNRVRTVLEA